MAAEQMNSTSYARKSWSPDGHLAAEYSTGDMCRSEKLEEKMSTVCRGHDNLKNDHTDMRDEAKLKLYDNQIRLSDEENDEAGTSRTGPHETGQFTSADPGVAMTHDHRACDQCDSTLKENHFDMRHLCDRTGAGMDDQIVSGSTDHTPVTSSTVRHDHEVSDGSHHIRLDCEHKQDNHDAFTEIEKYNESVYHVDFPRPKKLSHPFYNLNPREKNENIRTGRCNSSGDQDILDTERSSETSYPETNQSDGLQMKTEVSDVDYVVEPSVEQSMSLESPDSDNAGSSDYVNQETELCGRLEIDRIERVGNIPEEMDATDSSLSHENGAFHSSSEEIRIKSEPLSDGEVDYEMEQPRGRPLYSEMGYQVFPTDDADDTPNDSPPSDEEQFHSSATENIRNENFPSSSPEVPFPVMPIRPGLLPVHVDDPLHGGERSEHGEDLRMTGVIVNIHAPQHALQSGNTDTTIEDDELGSLTIEKSSEHSPERLEAKAKLHEICARLSQTKEQCSPVGFMSLTPEECKNPFLNSVNAKESLQMLDNVNASENVSASFACKHCDKSFSGKSILEIHERFCVKEKLKKFRCQLCDKTFERKCNFTRHKCSLVEDRPHKCHICEKTFVRPSHLACHLLIHTGEKPYKCKYCDKAFTEKPNLARHELIHTGERPFECQDCLKVFTQKCHLIRHRRIHTSERPFECNHCGKAFVQESHLVRHELVHTGEKPYQCKTCGKRFTQNCSLTRHEEQIHSISVNRAPLFPTAVVEKNPDMPEEQGPTDQDEQICTNVKEGQMCSDTEGEKCTNMDDKQTEQEIVNEVQHNESKDLLQS